MVLRETVSFVSPRPQCFSRLRGSRGLGPVIKCLKVAGTSPCSKSQGLVASCELALFAKISSRRDQNLVAATLATNSNWFEFVGLVAGTKVGPCD